MGDYYSESGDDWSVDDDEEEEYQNQLLAPSNQTKVPPVAPPKPVGYSSKETGKVEEEDEEEYEYYDEDEEGEYEEEDYYDDDEEYEEYEEGEYEEEYEEEEYEEEGEQVEPMQQQQEEEEEEGEDMGFQQEEEEEEDDWFDEDDDEGFEDGDFDPTNQTEQKQSLLGKVGNATSNAISAVRKSLGRSGGQGGGGYVKPPTEEDLEGYAPAPIPIKIQRNPTPLEDRIPKSMRSKNNKLDYKQIKGKLKTGAPTNRPLTGLHKPVQPKAGGGGGVSQRRSKAVSRKPPPGSRAPGLVKPTPGKFKGPKESAQWVNKRKNLKQTNRPLTGLYKPVGGKQMSSAQSTEAVEGHVPSRARSRRKEGVVKGSKPKYERKNNAPRLESQRKKLRKAPRDRPLTGYYQPVSGKPGPQGAQSKQMVDNHVPQKKVRPASRKPGRGHKEGIVKGARPTYKKSSGPTELSSARGKLKKGPTPRPLTGYYQPMGGKKMPQEATEDTVNNFVPKPKSRNKERAAVKNI